MVLFFLSFSFIRLFVLKAVFSSLPMKLLVRGCDIEKKTPIDIKWLKDHSRKYDMVQHQSIKAVVSISSRRLSTSDKMVLNKGFNFAITLKQVPYLKSK